MSDEFRADLKDIGRDLNEEREIKQRLTNQIDMFGVSAHDVLARVQE